ncbi:MAG: hypothetical protein Q8O87_01845 [bacterium]|nr:hypothetical protein [bacterium]
MDDDQPIIKSLLDLDFYKLTMAQVAWRLHPIVRVKYRFQNRTGRVNLAEFINEDRLRDEFVHVGALRFTSDEIDYLKSLNIFAESFLSYLPSLRMADVIVRSDRTDFQVEVCGSWPEAILWETIILSIVNELYYRAVLARGGHYLPEVWIEGERRLVYKFNRMQAYPGIKFIEFGTRRRFSRRWQNYVVKRLKYAVPDNLLGTSNVLLAKTHNLKPIGTFAHEMDMIYSGIFGDNDDSIRSSHQLVLKDWWGQYGEPLSIALTDTFGTKFFFADFTPGLFKSHLVGELI